MTKQIKNYFMGTVLSVIIVFILITSGYCSPFNSCPGAKAKAMAGAFTAIADDTSSVWHNPAGFLTKRVALTAEWSRATTIDEENGSLLSDQNSWFLGGMINLDWLELIDLETGLFFYSPYTAKYWAYDDGNREKAWGHIHEVFQMFSIPVAKSFFDERLRLGFTLEWLFLDIGDSDLLYRDQWGWADSYSPGTDSENGFSGSLGALVTIVDNKSLLYNVKAGAVYRFKSSTDLGKKVAANNYDNGVGSVFFDKPQSFDLGISFAKTFTTDENFSLTLQYGSTDWGGASDGGDDFEYDKISFGAEYEITKKILFFRKTALRAGYYQSSASGDTNIWEWPDVTGITFGLGLSFGDISDENRDYFQFDLAQELRKLENDDYSDDASLTTVSFSWFF